MVVNQKPSRRQFIFQTTSIFLAANTSIYVIGYAFKGQDPRAVAGVKCPATVGPYNCAVSIPESTPGTSIFYSGDECSVPIGGTYRDLSADCRPDGTWHFGS